MTYAVGTYIDLTHLNAKTERVEKTPELARALSYDAGTQLIFRCINGRFVTARKINVAFA